ncbi:MAG: topoisomerase DNA-binding C4 zinc finger domain-containing protein, partial [Candidatus Aenigmatarchaeota archaeon]
ILKEFKKNEKKIGEKLLEGLQEARKEERRLGICPKCGSELRIIRSKRTGLFFVGCSGYPKCNKVYPLPRMAKIQAVGKACEKCNTPLIQVIRKGKRPFRMCLEPNCPTKVEWK